MGGTFIELAGALKTSTDVIKALWNLSASQDSEVQRKIHELNVTLLAAQRYALQAQTQQAKLLAERDDLRAELKAVQSFEEEKKKYRLMKTPVGVIVYGLREDLVNGEPQHYLCPNCFADAKKSFLQLVLNVWRCSRCELTAG